MKALLSTLLLIASFGLLSQERPIAYYEYNWDENRFDWQLVNEFRYQYDQDDSLTQYIQFSPGNPLIVNSKSKRKLVQYDRNGKITYELREIKEGDEDWQNAFRYYGFTDGDGFRHWTKASWRNTYWLNDRRYRYKETPLDSFIIAESYYDRMREGVWTNYSLDSALLDQSGNSHQRRSYSWDGSGWMLMSSWENEYSLYGDKIRWRQNNHAQVPPNYFETRWTFSYDANGNPWEEESERRSGYKPEWEHLYLIRRGFDNQGRKTKEEVLYENYQNLQHQSRTEFEYRGDTIIERVFGFESNWVPLTQKWELKRPGHIYHPYYARLDSFRDGKWQFVHSSQYDFTYDDHGLISEIIKRHQTKTSLEENPIIRYYRDFDEHGRMTHYSEHHYNFGLEQFVPYQKKLWIYPTASIQKNAQFSLYPQPTEGPFSIQFVHHTSQPVQVQILDIQGKILQTQAIDLDARLWGMSVEMTTKTAGLYFVRVVYEDGSSRTQKLKLE